MRVGIVGNNLYGQIFARSVLATGRAQVVAICPEFDESLEPLAGEHALHPYADLASMLKAEQLDGVLIASVTAHHEADAVACLAAGVHVLVDRPMALTPQACDHMAAAAASAQRVLMVGYVLEFWPEYVEIRERIRRGDLGRISAVTASRVSGVLNPAWQARLLHPAYGLGGLEAHAHDVDLLLTLFGEPRSITAHGTFTPDGCCAQVHTLIQFADGCRAGVEADYGVPLNFPLSMYLRVDGERGALVFTFRGALAAREAAQRRLMLFRTGEDPLQVAVPVVDAYVGMMNHWLDCVEHRKPPEWGGPAQGRLSVDILRQISSAAQAQPYGVAG